MDIGIVVKPPAEDARLQELRDIVARLREAGHRVRVRVTFEGGDARRLARAAAAAGCELVIAAGGDGTVNEVVNGLASARRRARLAIVPFGTANDFASGLAIPPDTAGAIAVALEGEPLDVDIGCVNGRRFINVSTGGFGASATADASLDMKRRLGGLAYILTGARKLVEMTPECARFMVDGETVHDGEFVFFAVGNAWRTGGGTRIAPRADVRDGKLDVVIVRGVSRLDFLSLLPDLRAGTHLESPDVLYLRAERVEVAADEELAVNVDGEPMRKRRFVYTLHDQPLTIMTPRDHG